MSFLDSLFTTDIARALKTPTGSIDVSASTPVTDYVLKAVDPTHAVWAPEAGGSGDPATDLATLSGSMSVDTTDPVTGAVFTAQSPTVGVWLPPAKPDARFAVVAPSVTSSWDLDARLWTSPDLATNGWTITDLASPFATLTRNGNINCTHGGSLPTGTYNSTLINGQLWLQLSTPALIWKATDSAVAYTYKSHTWQSVPSTNEFAGPFVCATGGAGTPHWNTSGFNFYYTGMQQANFVEAVLQNTTFTNYVNHAVDLVYTDEVAYLFTQAFGGGSQSASSRVVTALAGQYVNDSGGIYSRNMGSLAIDAAGLIVGSSSNEVVMLDFFRRLPTITYP